MTNTFNAKIPFPPTINHLYKRNGHRIFIDQKGKAWFEEAILMIRTTIGFQHHRFTGKLGLSVWLVPPTARKYDIDNRMKATLDAIEKSGLIQDDAQFYELMVRKYDKQSSGKEAAACYITIKELDDSAGLILIT